jgi:1-acyl-sn-glycerol-3-phosphate acyltransferase
MAREFVFYEMDGAVQYWMTRIGETEAASARALDRLSAQLFRLGVELLVSPRARWIGCEPSERQRIYFANHTSHLDFLVLWSVLPALIRAKVRPVAARDYWEAGPIRRHIAERVFRCVIVDRNHGGRFDSVAPLIRALDSGESLILFPEGTRGNGPQLQPFRSGLYHVAEARPGIELVPVWMNNNFRVLPKGSVLPIPQLCTATFGTPCRLTGGEEKHAFLQRLYEQLENVRKL